jgi:hypothetical protein
MAITSGKAKPKNLADQQLTLAAAALALLTAIC